MKIFPFFAFLFSAFWLTAQTEYTYVTDAQFFNTNDLLNYEFMPNEVQYSFEEGEKPQKIGIGKVRFKLTMGYLYVTQGDEKTSFNTNSINPEKYGFKADLMNARNPSEQGHLKIILNDLKQVDAIIFKKNRQSKEVTYFQSAVRDDINLRDNKYFTDKMEYKLSNIQHLFNQKPIKPFFAKGREQKRIFPKDSVSFTFTQKEVAVGKKTKMEYTVAFKYVEHKEDADPETKTEEYIIKKFQEVEAGMAGKMKKAIEMEIKDSPKGNMLLTMSPANTLEAIQFGDTIFLLRDKTLNGKPEQE